MSNRLKLITSGFIKNNPTFVLLLGMCPTLATTTSAINGMSMGLATLFVLVLSNMAISALAPYVPDKVHIPVYIVVIATFVTLLQFIMQAYTPAMYETLGLFIPLIVVNCIILARAESFASKHNVLASACDGLFTGLGFTVALTLMGAFREILGSGAIFGVKLWDFQIAFFSSSSGAFFTYAIFIAMFSLIFGKITDAKKKKAYAKINELKQENAVVFDNGGNE